MPRNANRSQSPPTDPVKAYSWSKKQLHTASTKSYCSYCYIHTMISRKQRQFSISSFAAIISPAICLLLSWSAFITAKPADGIIYLHGLHSEVIVTDGGVWVDPDGTKACEPGFHMEADSICEPNMCYCDNGVVATGSNCAEDNTEICTTCSNGYHLKGELCKPNMCDCDDGIGASAEKCVVDGDSVCDSCHAGFTLVNAVNATKSCMENVCTCTNGQPATGEECNEDGVEICGDCNPTFYFDELSKLCKSEPLIDLSYVTGEFM